MCNEMLTNGPPAGEPMCEVSACSHVCVATPRGPACACPAPLLLQRDGATCGARHACADWGVCSQACRPHKQRYRCACEPDYRLADDGFTCKSTLNATPLLVFSNRHEVRALELTTLSVRALVSSLRNAISLDWRMDPEAGVPRLYWTDVGDDNIYTGLIRGNGTSLAARRRPDVIVRPG